MVEDTVCFVTEFLNGSHFSRLIRKEFLDEKILRLYVKNIVAGIQTLHDHGFMHRDIKLENIVTHKDPATGKQRAVVIDTGLAKQMAENDEQMKGNHGTPLYNSPEAVIFTKQNSAVDWWALGLIIYRALFDKFPCDMCDLALKLQNAESETQKGNIVLEFVKTVNDSIAMVDDSFTESFRKFIAGLLSVWVEDRLGSNSKVGDAAWLNDKIFAEEIRKIKDKKRAEFN